MESVEDDEKKKEIEPITDLRWPKKFPRLQPPRRGQSADLRYTPPDYCSLRKVPKKV